MEARWRGKGGEGTVLLDISLERASNAQLQTPTIGSWSWRAMEIGATVRSAFPNLLVYLTPNIQQRRYPKVFLNALHAISSPINALRTFPFVRVRVPILDRESIR